MSEKEVKLVSNVSWHSQSKEEVIKELGTSHTGLSQEEAKHRLEKYGKNEIKKKDGFKALKILLEQFNSFFIYILLAAIVISLFIQNYTDAIVISVIVILNASIGFFQQYKAELAIDSLKKLLVPTSIVVRGGRHMEIPSIEIVPGDILIFSAGNKVNADCRIIEEKNLQANEAVLTGESFSVIKSSKILDAEFVLSDRENMLYTGTSIVSGTGRAVVVAIGMNTEFGKIASQLQEIEIQKTPMQKKLNRFSKQIGLIILGMVLIVMLLGIFGNLGKLNMLMTAIALAVSAIPEGLPAVLAISFAISSVFMAKKNVIIRKLPAIESLGSVTVICTDKTGTLTEEKMYVQQIFSSGKLYHKDEKGIFINNKKVNVSSNKELYQLVKTSVLCNNARYEMSDSGKYSFIGDPTEESLVRLGIDLKFDKKKLTEEEPRLKEFEFSSERKLMSILRQGGRGNILYSKGAPEKIINLCSHELINGNVIQITPQRRRVLLHESSKLEADALRVLAFAYKNFHKKEEIKEKGLIFLGLMGMIDPPRKEVKNAITECKKAGITIKIITGDSALTAKAIAIQIGLSGEVMTGEELAKTSESDLESVIDRVVIFARTTPQQKLLITKILQGKGEIVAITGDGINDVLALKAADIGIAMGQRGADVARDVSEVVLMDDNFASIAEGVKEGRKSYDNIKKFTKFFLAVNFSEVLLVMFPLFFLMPLPLLPLQILWHNLITDSLPGLSLVFEKEESSMRSKPRSEKSLLNGSLKFIILGGILAFLSGFIVYLMGINSGWDITKIRTMTLITITLFQLFFVYTCRSKRPLLEHKIFSNKYLNYSILISLIAVLILLYTPLSLVFGVTAMTFKEWLIVLPFALSGLIIFEISKYIKTKKGNVLEDGIK